MRWEHIVGKERKSFLGMSNHREFRLKELAMVFSLHRLRIWYWTEKLVEGGSGSSECSFSKLPLALFLPGALFFVCQDQRLPCWPGSAQQPRAASLMCGNSPLWGCTGQLCVPRPGKEAELPQGLAGMHPRRCPYTVIFSRIFHKYDLCQPCPSSSAPLPLGARPGDKGAGSASEMLAIFFLHGLWEQLLIISDPETI